MSLNIKLDSIPIPKLIVKTTIEPKTIKLNDLNDTLVSNVINNPKIKIINTEV